MAHNIKLLKPESQTTMVEFQRNISNTKIQRDTKVQSDAESEDTEMKTSSDENESSFSEHRSD